MLVTHRICSPRFIIGPICSMSPAYPKYLMLNFKMYAIFPVFFNQRSINKITSRIRCTSTQDISWENPHGGEKPSKPFPYIRVSSNNVMTSLGMPLAKTSEGEGNVPRARTYPTESLFTKCAKPRAKVRYNERERYITKA